MRFKSGSACTLLSIAVSLCTFTTTYAQNKTCYVYHTSPYGFGSNFFGLLMAVAVYGVNNNTTIYIEEDAWAYKCRGKPSWTEFFVGRQPQALPGPWAGPGESGLAEQGCTTEIDLYYENAQKRLKHLDSDHVRPLLGKTLREIWMLSDRMQKLANAQTSFTRTLRRPVLAVHVRSGDKHGEDLLAKQNPGWYNNSDWLSSLMSHMELHELKAPGTCLILGDGLQANSAVAAVASKNLSCAVLQMGGRNGGHQQEVFAKEVSEAQRGQGQDLGCMRTEEFILNLVAMSRADMFVGSFNSNVGRLVHLLRTSVYLKPVFSTKDIMHRAWHQDAEHEQ